MNGLPQFLKDMIACPPKHGDGVHNHLYRVARHLHAHRSPEDIFALLKASLIDCGRNVPDREIRDAIRNSEATAWQPCLEKTGDWGEPNKKRPEFDKTRWEQVVAENPFSVADILEKSPVRFDEQDAVAETILPQLFPDNPLICAGWSKYEAMTKPLSEFAGELSTLQFVVPSPMSKPIGKNKEGKDSTRCLDNTGPRMFLVAELDKGELDQQASVIKHLTLRYPRFPLVLVVFSGGKSLHPWFHSRGANEADIAAFINYAATLGADPQMLCACQFARMPGGQRDNGKRQEVYYWNPKAAKKKADARPEAVHGKNGSAPEVIYQEIDPDSFVDEDDEPVPEFPLDTLPDTFRKPVEELMRHYRVPALLPATCALLINSAALGRGVFARSNVRKTYANLYAMIVAESGTGKGVIFHELMDPLEQMQKEAFEQFNSLEGPRAQADLELLKRDIAELTSRKKNPHRVELGEDFKHERLSELLQQKAELEDKLQAAMRLYCEDFTSEAFGLLLASNNGQMSVLTEEGGVVLYNILGRYTKGDATDDITLCKARTLGTLTVDRVGRSPIIVRQACASLLMLVQPDLLRKAYENERLLIGGFLARTFTADSKLQWQYETEEDLPPPDEEIMAKWGSHIRALVKMFRWAEEPYEIPVNPEVYALSRRHQNEIVDKVRRDLADVSSFAARWRENAWGLAINLYIGLYGEDCGAPLSVETFKNAIRISDYFADRQLEVLQRPRIEAADKVFDRLKELFERNNKTPLTLRSLVRHGVKKDQVISCVKSHEAVFGIVEMKPSRGSKSTLVFLWSNPPPGLGAKK